MRTVVAAGAPCTQRMRARSPGTVRKHTTTVNIRVKVSRLLFKSKLSPLPSLLVCCGSVVLSADALWRLCFVSPCDDGLSETRLCYPESSADAHLQWAYEYESGSDSDADRPDPDLVLDDLASRRFHSPSPAPPTNFAVPSSPLAAGRASGGRGGPWPKVTIAPQQNVTFLRSENMKQQRCDFDVPA